MMKKVGPEPSLTACTWPVQPIYIYDEKNVAPLTSPTACTGPVQNICILKKVGQEASSAACTWYVQPIYMIKMLVQRLHLQPLYAVHPSHI
jgi:hypothetical protein